MSSTQNKDQCKICQKDLSNTNKYVTAICGHSFHDICVEQYCERQQTNNCPVCKKRAALIGALESYVVMTRSSSSQAKHLGQVS